MSACPTVEEIELLARGELGGPEALRVRGHLDGCTPCRQQYDQCLVNRDFANELRAVLGQSRTTFASVTTTGPGPKLRAAGPRAPPIPAIEGYRVIRELQRGGQGVVYEAFQEATHRRVALKVMLGGPFAGEASKRRFEREIELAANLRHPNIVTIHDSGVAGGCYYFVMDYVDGVRLDEYVKGRRGAGAEEQREESEPRASARAESRWSVRDTLRLFGKVCDAVNYAHQRGVIHRDLKPSNILVDADGEPRVLDFGLAKQLEESETQVARSVVSLEGQVVGTLAYMSPEQARGQHADIDIRSDVYSLGVMLYEVLTGQLPCDVSRPVPDALSRIVQAEPPRPSALNHRLDNEIETIILKALAKESDRRYQTAGDLGKDIIRYLAGDPIEAKRDRTLYVLRKTLRRYRVPAAIAGAFVVVLAAATGVSIYAWRQATDRAERLRWRDYCNRLALAGVAYRDGHGGRLRQFLEGCPDGLRGWEWDYLNGLCDQSEQTLSVGPASGEVGRVVVAPDGRILAPVGDSLCIWGPGERSSGVRLRRPASNGEAAACTPDGRWIVTGHYSGELVLWDLTTHSVKCVPGAHAVSPCAVTFTADAERILSVSLDGVLRVWDRATMEPLPVLGARRRPDARSAAFSPGGEWLATGYGDGALILGQTQSDQEGALVHAHDSPVWALAFSPDAAHLASGGADGEVKVWDCVKGTLLRQLPGRHIRGVTALTWSLDGKLIVSGGEDSAVRVWDAVTAEALGTLLGHEGPIQSLSFAPDGLSFVSSSMDGRVKVWDARRRGAPLSFIGHADRVGCVAFSLDGSRLATGSQDNTLCVWDARTGELLSAIRGHEAGVNDLVLTLDGSRIISAGGDHTVRIWDAATGQPVRVCHGHTGPVVGLAMSPDGRSFASFSLDRTVRLWSRAGEALGVLKGHTGHVHDVAFAEGGAKLVSAGADHTVRVWDVSSGQELRRFRKHENQAWRVAVNRAGPRVASGDQRGVIWLWDLHRPEIARRLRGHQDAIQALAFSPDGKRLISGSADGTLRLCYASTGDELLTLPDVATGLRGVAWSPDGRTLVTCGGDAVVTAWETEQPPSELRARRELIATAGREARRCSKEFPLVEDVVHCLMNASLEEPVRSLAVHVAEMRGSDARRLNNDAWDIVRTALSGVDEYTEALRKAELACRLAPEQWNIQNTLGAAQYRCGRYDEAIATLQRANAIDSSVARENWPFNDVFIAMALRRLGRTGPAAATLENVEKWAREHAVDRDVQLLSLAEEAARLIRGPAGDPDHGQAR